MRPLSYSVLCIAAAAASFAGGRWTSPEPAATSPEVSAPVAAAASPLDARSATWAACWEEAGPAERDVLLQSWIERDPRAAFQFIVRLPPGTLPGQYQLERQAFDAWGRREPVAAYTFAAIHRGLDAADELFHNTLSRDEDAALAMLRSRVERNGCGGGPWDWMKRDPAHAAAMAATLPRGIKQDSLLGQAFGVWAEKDAAAAIDFALELPRQSAGIAIRGIVQSLPPAEAAALIVKLKEPTQAKAAVDRLMVDWGRKDPAAATAWAMENLPPAGLTTAMSCFECNVIKSSIALQKGQTLVDVLKAFTPAAWLATAGHIDSGTAPLYLQGAPEWFLPRIYERLPGKTADLTQWAEPEKAPEWFRQLPEDQAADVIKAMAKRESQRESWPSLASIPSQWQDAAARGILENMTSPRGAVEEKVLALPPEERALLRAQLSNVDQSLPKLPRLRELLGE